MFAQSAITAPVKEQVFGHRPTHQKWNEEKLKALTRELSQQGLYRSETEPMVPRALRFPVEALMPSHRSFDSEFLREKKSALELLFQDDCFERAKTLPSKHPGFLQDGIGSLILRRAPASLREAIARDLVENGGIDFFSTKFRLTALMISRGIRDQETIEDLSFDTVITFREFQSYQVKFERMISSAKTHFFSENKSIDRVVGQTIWERFDAGWKSLSVKQKSALEIHIMSDDPMSLEEGAKRLKITKASFRERVQSGIKKIEKALPELAALKPTKRTTVSGNKKEKPKKFPARKDAPNRHLLNEWLERTTPEPKWSEWDSVFRKPSQPDGLVEL